MRAALITPLVTIMGLVGFFAATPSEGLTAAGASGNPAHEKLAKLSEPQRREALTQLLQRSGEDCDRVVRSFFQGFSKAGHAFWNVACQNKRALAIMIENNAAGSTQVLDCKVLKAVGGAECFTKF